MPTARWLRGELRPIVEDIVFHDQQLVKDVLGGTEVRVLWKEHPSGARDHSVFLWGLMMLGLWQRGAGCAFSSADRPQRWGDPAVRTVA